MFNSYYEKVAQKTVKIDKDIPFDIPSNWQWVRLSEITNTISAGGDRPDVFSKIKTEQCQIPIFSNGIESDGLYGYTNTAKIYDRSITVSARGTIGFSCIRNEPYVPIVRLISVVPNVNISLDYLYIFFSGAMESGDGTSTPQLTVPNIKQKFIALPPREEQDRIVRIVNTATGIIKKIAVFQNDLLELCSQLKSAILAVFFGENSRYKSYSENMKDLGLLVSGRDLTPDCYNSNNDGIPYLTGASNFENDSVIVNRWTPKPVVISYNGDVLITCKGTIGKTAINQIGKCHIARQIMAFRCGEKLLPEYVKMFFDYRTQELQRASSSLIPGISRDIMLNMVIPLPSIEIQDQIVKNIKTMFAQIERIVS